MTAVLGLDPVGSPLTVAGGADPVAAVVFALAVILVSADVIMVIVTTMATPPALKWSLARREHGR
ncbi:MAG: hypothetical protein ACREL9_03045 [Gemmatimonadales bacterium]